MSFRLEIKIEPTMTRRFLAGMQENKLTHIGEIPLLTPEEGQPRGNLVTNCMVSLKFISSSPCSSETDARRD